MNLLLELAVIGAFVTGITSWAVGTGWNRWWTAAHAVCGLSLLLLAPAKLPRLGAPAGCAGGAGHGGCPRRSACSCSTVVGLGVAHATGLWYGRGYWSALWIHFLAAFLLVPLFVWHVLSRPLRAKRVDLDRRMLLGSGAVLGAATAAVAAVEGISAAARHRRRPAPVHGVARGGELPSRCHAHRVVDRRRST